MQKWTATLAAALSTALVGCSDATYTVTAGGTNVIVLPASVQVSADATQGFLVTPAANYVLTSEVGGTCPAGSWSGSVYTTGAITADCNLVFNATVQTFEVWPSGSDVMLSPSTMLNVNVGSTQAFTVTPNAGYTVSPVVGGSCAAGGWTGNVYTTGPIADTCAITFSADMNALQVSVTAENVMASPSGDVMVSNGATQTFAVTPDQGYVVTTDVGGSCPSGSWFGDMYTTGAVTASCSVVFNGTPAQ